MQTKKQKIIKDSRNKKSFELQSHERGAAMMISLIFFILASVLVVLGLTGPSARQYKIANDSIVSRQSYFLSESGVEDAFYRIKNSMTIGSSVTLVLGASSTVTTITNLSGGQKQITGMSDVNDYNRAVDLIVATGAGIAFNYGVQVGQGGLNLTGSGTVNGNVYANGPITGDSSGAITGSATSANSAALVADQSNGTGTPANNVTFGNSSGTQDVAQSFQVGTSSPINKIQLYIKKNGSPSNATVRIMDDASGVPGTVQYASGTLSASTVTTTYGWIDVAFTTNPLLSVGVPYWLVVDAGTSSSNYYILGAGSAGYASGIGKIGQYPSTWNNTTPSGLDYFFKIYLGGFTGLIQGNSGSVWNPLHVGTVSGDARAHTVNYTNVTGTLYCAAGTGNNKSCTTATDSVSIPFPISDANIAQWEADAVAGGTLTGNYAVGWAGATVGPKKIVGNLTVSGGGTLTVSGTLHVTGNLSLSGGGRINLASSYGSLDGVIVVDGTITVSGGGFANGSGTAGSYIMMVSKSVSSTAISASGGSGSVILYTPNGTIAISGGASLKEAVGYRITISSGSTLTYDSGLANLNFNSGPSGSYTINSWEETQ